MKILLDGTHLLFEDKCGNLEEKNEAPSFGILFSSIFELCQSKKRAIDKVIIDGEQLELTELKNILEIKIDKFDCVEFFSVNKEELFEKLKNMGIEFINIAKQFEDFSMLLNEGKDIAVLNILQTVSLLVRHLFLFHSLFMLLDIPMEYPVAGKAILEYKNEINSLLKSVVDAFEKKDVVEASDIAEYELSPLLSSLGNGLIELS